MRNGWTPTSYLPRHLASVLERAMRTFPAVLVTGARQTGKTTLLRQELRDSHGYVSLEQPDLRARALADPNAFLAEHGAPVVLDEIQYAPELLPYLKSLIDADRRPGGWVLTGSQRFDLMQGVSETLAGRVAVLELGPLSVQEMLRLPAPESLDEVLNRTFSGATQHHGAGPSAATAPQLGDWLLRGGYPEPRLNAQVDRRLWFGSYVQTYLERDVRDLVQVADLGAFGRFLALIASRTGCLVNLAELGRDVGVSAPTARRWLSVLETSHVVYLLPPYHRSFGKRLRKSPKLFVLDPGLVTFLVGLHSPEAVLHGPMLGALAETAVVSEWIKVARHAGERPDLFYWRSSDGLEVDLVFERGAQLYGIEVKATATPMPRHAEALRRWLDLAGRGAAGILACQVAQPTTVAPHIKAVPWYPL